MNKRLSASTETIAAIATAPGRGGIGVVRVSGPHAALTAITLLGRTPAPRQATYAAFRDAGGAVIDRGIAIYYPAPNSYTGEDVLELQAHGGVAVLQLLLKRCLIEGVRLAQPGEFTKRAFLNNKLDLIQAEGVADLIDATSEQAVRCANRSLAGDFSKTIHEMVAGLIELRMLVESSLDFPEEGLDLLEKKRSEEMLSAIRVKLEQTLLLAHQGSVLREGAQVALVGQPNVGKSSLLNRLSGEEVALVSEIAGTTRDAIRQTINIKGVPLHITDTAGLRESPDIIEQMGMERTKQAIQKADIVIVLMEPHHIEDAEQKRVTELIPENTPTLYVINKIDLMQQTGRIETVNKETHIYISAKTAEGIDLLRDEILRIMDWHGESGVFMARERHLQALSQARAHLKVATDQMASTELFAEELRLAQNVLTQITGDFTSDDLLGEIFSRFCIGK